jgi:hypothetical protein
LGNAVLTLGAGVALAVIVRIVQLRRGDGE